MGDDAVSGEAQGLGPGAEVDHFRVIRQLGAGGMGQVWLARDLRLGRKVALKIINPDRLTSPDARARFLREAEATARFAHPNIVTLYEVGETRGMPYVALELIEGDTLRDRLERERPPLRQALELAHAIASATAEAHRHGVLHLDLKPANVILGRDGRARVVDFGLSRRTPGRAPSEGDDGTPFDDPGGERPPDPQLPGHAGTPRYMAPEQWRGGGESPATDVWALGLLVHELVHGRHPYADFGKSALRRAVLGDDRVPIDLGGAAPPLVSELIVRCLVKDAGARPTAEQVADAIARSLERTAAGATGDTPFRGLLPFTERQADAFFGRDAEIASLLERLRDEPILPIVGPSGAGKSSFVQAGVIPRLREAGAWAVLALRPGARPFAALAELLLRGEASTVTHSPGEDETTATIGPGPSTPRATPAAADADTLAAELAARPETLGLRLRAFALAQRLRVLVFVDQLEELYTHTTDDRERRAFMRAVLGAADDRDDPIRVCFTLRDDFLGRVAEEDATRAALGRVTILRAPGADALREILEAPAARAGFRWEAGLVDEIVLAVRGQAGSLPVVQFTARQVWHRRDVDRRLLTRKAYDEIGGVAGALAAHADGVLAGLPPADVRVARAVCLRLVTAEGTRRVVARAALTADLPPTADEVVTRFVEARLLTARRGRADSGDAEIELAHESLVRGWDRLARWLDETKDELAALDEIAQAAALWARRGRRDAELWRGDALAEARRLLARLDQLPDQVTEFLAACERAARRARRRRRGAVLAIILALAGVAVAAIAAAVRISGSEHRATRRLAEAQREAARAALAADDPLQARAKLRGSLETEDSPLGRALWLALDRSPEAWRRSFAAGVYGVALSPDESTVAAVGQDGAAYLIDLDTGAARVLHGTGDQLFAVAFAPDGRSLATGAWDGTVAVWDVASGAARRLGAHRGQVTGVAFRDAGELVSVGADGTLRRWDPATGALRARLTADGADLSSVDVDGDVAVTASGDGVVRRWDLDAGTSATLSPTPAASARIDRAGHQVVIGGKDGALRAVPLGGGPARELGVQAGRVSVLAIGGRRVASAGLDGSLRVWDLDSGRELGELPGHTDEIDGLALSRDGKRMVSASNDQSVRLWRLDAAGANRPDPGHSMPVVGVDISADGTRLVSGAYDQTVRSWDAATGRPLAVFRGHRGRVWSVKVVPHTDLAISASNDGTLRVWDLAHGTSAAELVGHTGPVSDVAVTGDGATAVSGGADSTVRLWDLHGFALVRTIAMPGTVDGVAITGDGARVAAGGHFRTIFVFDAATGAQQAALAGHGATVLGVAFSPDGRALASSSEDGELRVWDLATDASRVVWHGERLYRVAFTPDGARVAAAGADGVGHIIDLGTGAITDLRGHYGEVNEVRFSADGTLAVTGGNDGTVRLWDARTGAPRWRAVLVRARAAEVLTHRGWSALGGGAIDPAPAAWRAAAARADVAAETDDGARACLYAGGALAVWDVAADRELARWPLDPQRPPPARLVAAAGGCAVIDGAPARARLYAPDRAPADLGDGVSAIDSDRGDLLLALGGRVVARDASGAARELAAADPGATAIARLDDGAVIVGYPDGNAVRLADGARVTMESVPASPVVAARAGPAGTVVLGFASGAVGLWHAASGVRIYVTAVHGPARHLIAQPDRVIAVSELGDQVAVDVAPLAADYCTLLRSIWAEVPITWEGDRPVRAPPPRHVCAP